ncbi:MAG TPA: c-type cytochrome [Burkholderiaceae bacterium]
MTPLLRIVAAGLLAAAAAAQAQDGDLGRNLAATCANCHGTNGQARGDTITALSGMPADRLLSLWNGFKSGERPATIMHQISRGYSDDQVRAIAAFFASQPSKK